LNITNHSENPSSYVPEFIEVRVDTTEKVREQSTTLHNASGVYTQHSITRWVGLIGVRNFKFHSTASRANWHFIYTFQNSDTNGYIAKGQGLS